jgi:hypothetical protein
LEQPYEKLYLVIQLKHHQKAPGPTGGSPAQNPKILSGYAFQTQPGLLHPPMGYVDRRQTPADHYSMDCRSEYSFADVAPIFEHGIRSLHRKSNRVACGEDYHISV